MKTLKSIGLSPVTNLFVATLIATSSLLNSTAFERLTYAISYAHGHTLIGLWTEHQANELVQQAWANTLPEILLSLLVIAGITIVALTAQRALRPK